MINDTKEAWMIHKYWLGDTSVRLLFFTEKEGVIHCFYKGGRAPKKQGVLQPFISLWLSVTMRGEACYLRGIEANQKPLSLEKDGLFAGLYLNELVFRGLKPCDPHPRLYDAYVQALYAISTAHHRLEIEGILRRFEWVLLTTIGYSITLTHDARTGKPIELDKQYIFVADEGVIRTEQGFLGADLLALTQNELNHPRTLRVAKQLMRQAIHHALEGKVIETRALYCLRKK